jgi:hypothetical protein
MSCSWKLGGYHCMQGGTKRPDRDVLLGIRASLIARKYNSQCQSMIDLLDPQQSSG